MRSLRRAPGDMGRSWAGEQDLGHFALARLEGENVGFLGELSKARGGCREVIVTHHVVSVLRRRAAPRAPRYHERATIILPENPMRRSLIVFTVVAFAACSRATPEQQVVDDAAEALGGRDRVLAVRSLV